LPRLLYRQEPHSSNSSDKDADQRVPVLVVEQPEAGVELGEMERKQGQEGREWGSHSETLWNISHAGGFIVSSFGKSTGDEAQQTSQQQWEVELGEEKAAGTPHGGLPVLEWKV